MFNRTLSVLPLCITDEENEYDVYGIYLQVATLVKRQITTHKNISGMIKPHRIEFAIETFKFWKYYFVFRFEQKARPGPKVPILALPFMAEQHLNARMVTEEIGVGLRIMPRNGFVRGFVEAEEVEKMVRELMEGEKGEMVRKNWEKMQRKL
ncbi:hypothetical protein H5410_020733 [Solanum commersonii]|uniref:Uncharacterized protein n=1 Tax=Solanum commersonii TaxID=4109 RepID=A0A9J5ZD70_SOLCO|nr:hypothetical protein H5410_020733 [Solanum commersonii]